MYSNNIYKKKYLKYKKKYINLKNKINKKKVDLYNLVGGGCTEKIITIKETSFNIDNFKFIKIDDYYFKIIFKLMFSVRIGFLIISSLYENFSEYDKFVVYSSQSELDLKRLFYMKDININHYYKGNNDYTQQTLIDLRLQKFICSVEDRLTYIKFHDYLYPREINEIGVITDDIKDNIDEPKRILNIDPFINLFKNQCGVGQNINDTRPDKEIYDEIKLNLNKYSNQLESYFDIDNPKFLYSYKKDIKVNELGNEIIVVYFLMSVFSVNLIDKHNEENKFILYFMIYDLCNFNYISLYDNLENNGINDEDNYEKNYSFDSKYSNSYIKNKKCKYRNYFAPISIVPYNGQITKYGLQDCFIKTGNYSCKPIEYNSQCTKYENNLYIIGDTNYTFIGNRYNDLFPFNIIRQLYPETIENHRPPNMWEFLQKVPIPTYTR